MSMFVYVLLGLLIAIIELPRFIKNKSIDALTFFNCYFFVFYVFVPLNVVIFGADVVRQKYVYEQFGYGNIYTAISLFLTYVLFYFGSWVTSSIFCTSGSFSFSLERFRYISYVVFILGFITISIHAYQVGGFYDVILKARELRSGELQIESKFLFFRHFNPFLSDAFVMAFVLVIGKKTSKIKISKPDYLFLICTFLFFIYLGLSTMGRRTFIFPLLICYLVSSSMKIVSIKQSFFVMSLILLIAGLGTMIGSLGPYETSWDIFKLGYNLTLQGLGDSFIHFVGAEKADIWQFGFLTDIVNLPRDFFPSQLFNFERTRHMYGETSEFFLGHKLQDGFSGEEPLGLHGYLLVNFGYVGMLLIFFFMGAFYNILHMSFRPGKLQNSVGWLLYWWIIFAFFVYFRDGVLILVIKPHLTWWVIIVALLFTARKKTGVCIATLV